MKIILSSFTRQNLLINRKILSAVISFCLIVGCLETANAQLNVSLQAQGPLCGGFSTGWINAIVSGGSGGPYTYLWSTGATSNSIQNLPVGNYSVTVTNAFGVTGSASTILTAPAPIQATISISNCNIPGSMTINVTGGVTPYSYMWSTGASTATISIPSPGQYCVTVMDNFNCGYATCTTFGTPLSAQVTTTAATCSNPAGGSATVTPTGGVIPLSYLWSNGATTQTVNNLQQGFYTVTVTGSNGCSSTSSGTVALTNGGFNATLNTTQPVCAGSATGSITTTVTSGAPPLTFAWSSGQTTQNISNLGPGQYTVTVTDGAGCTVVKSSTLAFQSNFSIVLNPTNATCNGVNNGAISVAVNNGSGPFSYLWSTGATAQNISNLAPGAYSVTVTDNLNCTKTATANISAQPSFSLSLNITNASNCGASDGTATTQIGSGGTPPYAYAWSNASNNSAQGNLPAGTYSVTVASSQGCTATASGTVSQPQNLLVNLDGSTQICGSNNDGFISSSVTFGTAPYTFAWNNGGDTQALNNLPPGTYTVTVTSSQGCTGSATKTINGIPEINLSGVVQNVKCFGTNAGSITMTASGGAAPLSFVWNNGASTQSLMNVPAGAYSLTVTDNAGCSKTQNFNITQPSPLNISFNTSGGSCGSNGTATVNVQGGSFPYTYLWNNGQTTQTVSNLPAGTYTVTVTDANNCLAVSNAIITAYPTLNLNVTSTNTTCNGTTDGTATASVTGGTAPFQYQWNSNPITPSIANLSPGTYAVTVTDANGCTKSGSTNVSLGTGLNVTIDAPVFICPGETATATALTSGGMNPYSWNWSNTANSQSADNLNPGTYSVTATDVLGCFGTASVTLLPGGGFAISPVIENASCFNASDGSIALSVNGGTIPFGYLWNTGATTPTLFDLAAGDYIVTVTDSTECFLTQSFTVGQPSLLELNLDVFNGDCTMGGVISAFSIGGTQPYDFQWSHGETTPFVSNLIPDEYYLTVTDGNGCEAIDSATITPIPIPECTIEITQEISGPGASDGQLTAVVNGGTAPFNFAWNVGQNTQTATNLGEDFYSVTVSDANNCQTTCTIDLSGSAKIGDFVWLDANENGIQDNGEGGLEGVSITLTGTNIIGNNVDLSTTSGPNGMYMFVVQPGTYKMTFSQPAGYAPSPANQGTDDDKDSDVNVFTGMTPLITVASGDIDLTIDAGFYLAPPCDNITVPGTICCNQTLCGPGVDPAPITEATATSGGTGNIQFLWMYTTVPGPFDPNGWTVIDSATSPGYDPGPLYETTYFIRCVRRANCIQFLESNIVTITVGNDAFAQINAPEGGCVNTPIDFTATDNGPNTIYSWNFGPGATPPFANTKNVPGVVWSGFGLKTVKLTLTRNGCTSTDLHEIYVTNLPEFCGNALIINANAIERTTVEVDWFYERTDSVQRNYTLEWAWENNDFQPVEFAFDSINMNNFMRYVATHDKAQRGRNFYRVTLTDSDGTILVSNIAEVNVIGDINFVHVYPNPFSDFLTVELIDRFGDLPITFDLVSVEGRLLDVFKAPEEGFTMKIPTENLREGIYFLLVKYDGKPQKIFKLVK